MYLYTTNKLLNMELSLLNNSCGCAHCPTTLSDIKMAHWNQKYQIPKLKWTISGYSRSAYRTGFYIKDLDLMLDAGPQCFSKPSNILIGHTHIDHVANLPLTLIDYVDNTLNKAKSKPNIYTPLESVSFIASYINSMFCLNSCSNIDPNIIKSFYNIFGLKASDNIILESNKTKLDISILRLDHSVPTIGYGISQIKQKLKLEYSDLSTKELGLLKKSNVEITYEYSKPSLAYVCDTSIRVFDLNPKLLDYPTIIIECTFLYAEHKSKADSTQHIHWSDLKPYIESNPMIDFILIHFSMQYKDSDIVEFFNKELQNITNVKIWV